MFVSNMASTAKNLALSVGAGSMLSFIVGYYKINIMTPFDLWVSCVLITSWAMFLLPGLIERLNISLIKDVFVIFFKLWTVDLVFSGFAKLRGYGNGYTYIMDDGWFFKTTGFMRAAVVVSCIVVSTISYITRELQRQRSKRLLLSRLQEKKMKL